MGKHDSQPWCASPIFASARNFAETVHFYETARAAALEPDCDDEAAFFLWSAGVDRVIGAPVASPADLAAKVRIMMAERRGGDDCLIAILGDLDRMAGGYAGGEAVTHA